MNRILATVLALVILLPFGAEAQIYKGMTLEQVRQDKLLCTGNYLDCYHNEWPEPSPAPKGYKLVYLSTYARHGARLFSRDEMYADVNRLMEQAAASGQLTATGEEFLSEFRKLFPLVDGRAYDLTTVGQEQHRRHARRMFRQYAPLFKGSSHVDARATQLTRTILSMAACTEELRGLNPKLVITTSSSPVDMAPLNPTTKYNPKARKSDWSANMEAPDAPYQAELRRLWVEKCRPQEFFGRFFKDWKTVFGVYNDEYEAQKSFFYVLADSQCVTGDGRFLDFATPEELYAMYQCDNFRFCALAGMTRHFKGRPWALAEVMLRDFLDYAETDLAGGSRPGPYPAPAKVRMRYGHDYKISELLSLLDVDGFNITAMSPEESWLCYSYTNLTMGASLEMPFYRNSRGDVLVKLVLNGNELRLPIPGEDGPYYSWEAFRAYCRQRIDCADKLLETT